VSPARPDLTLVRGLTVGQAEDPEAASGVSVVRFERAVPTVVDVRGGASATYDTASLSLDATFGGRWALFLSGGSLYGLDAARGIRSRILETGGGHRPFRSAYPVAPVSGAALFDLPEPAGPLPEYLALGYEAASRADRRPIAVGRHGAGTGATVGKYLGRARSMHGGVGSCAARWRDGAIGVLLAVNSVGGVRDPSTGAWVAGARGAGGRIVPPEPRARRRPSTGAGTTLAIVATDVTLSRPALARVASIVHAGLARVLVPYQTSTDGDAVFVSSTGLLDEPGDDERPGRSADEAGTLAAECAVEAVLGAVRAANPRTRRG
jgi:L-aminopeptidase/D-esterase-like protein